MEGPLSGFKILDLSAVLSGPLATNWLCDQGAEVIELESFEGDILRHIQDGVGGLTPVFISSNRGKKAIAVDLKKEAGIELVKRMIPSIDVVVQNFRPGAIDRMGLGYEILQSINPRLVYCSISGFGDTGPYKNKRIYDPIIQGISGLAAIQGGRGQPPKLIKAPIPDTVTALTASQAITAALLSRERTGKGQHIKVAMVDAMIALTWCSNMSGVMLRDYRPEGSANAPRTGELMFKTADGYITLIAVSQTEWEGLCRALDLQEYVDHDVLGTPSGRSSNSGLLHELVAPVLMSLTTANCMELLDQHGVPCGPVLNSRELLNNEQIVANELIELVEHPGVGKVYQPRPAARFSETPARIQDRAPQLGEHTRTMLEAFDFTSNEIDDLYAQKVVR